MKIRVPIIALFHLFSLDFLLPLPFNNKWARQKHQNRKSGQKPRDKKGGPHHIVSRDKRDEEAV